MAIIENFDSGYYRIPLAVTLSDAMHGDMPDFELNTVRIRDSDGVEGVGYSYTAGANGAAIAATLRQELAEVVQGKDADLIEALWHTMWWQLHYGGRGGAAALAISAVDIALWDLKAKRAKQPLWRFLGGYDPHVPCYAGGIDLMLTPEALIEQTQGNLDKGFRAIKMKVGRDKLGEDVERISAMRQFLGSDFPLMVDANMRWTAEDAIRAAKAFAPYDLTWLEEPVMPEDIAGHARVRAEGGIAIASGENLRSLWDFKQLISSGGVSYPEPDVTNCGGVTAFMKITHLAEAFNLPVTSHGAHDITVHLLAACPNRSYLEAHGFGLDAYLQTPLLIKEGNAVAPDVDGHGVVFDWDALQGVRA